MFIYKCLYFHIMEKNTTHTLKALRKFDNIHQFTKFCTTCKLVTVWETFTDIDIGTELEFCLEHDENG